MSIVPDGWIRMAEYDNRPDKKHGNPGDDYRCLLTAAKKKEIDVLTVAGVRGMLVKKEQADSYIAKARRQPRLASPTSRDVRDSLERIEKSVELLSQKIERLFS